MEPITEKLITSPRRPNKKLKSLKGIVIHWTANTSPRAGAQAHWNYFNSWGTTDTRKASAHYLVDDQRIIRCIPDDEAAYHVGAKKYTEKAHTIMEGPGGNPNNYLIGLELCVNADSDLQKTRQIGAELTMQLLEKYGLRIDQVYTHHDITGKYCPQLIIDAKDDYDWQAFLQEVEAFRTAAGPAVAEPVQKEVVVIPEPEISAAVAEPEITAAAKPVVEQEEPAPVSKANLSFRKLVLMILRLFFKGFPA